MCDNARERIKIQIKKKEKIRELKKSYMCDNARERIKIQIKKKEKT